MSSDLTSVPGVGPVYRERLRRLGVESAFDLLYLLPRRYIDRSPRRIGDLKEEGEWVCVRGRVEATKVRPARRKGLRIVEALLKDATGRMALLWFFGGRLARSRMGAPVRPGQEIWAWGRLRRSHTGPELHNPEWIKAGGKASLPPLPVYPLTEGVTQQKLRSWISWALENQPVEEQLDLVLLERMGLLTLPRALRALHEPEGMGEPEAGRRRLAFGELFHFQLHMRSQAEAMERRAVPACPEEALAPSRFASHLPFSLTASQREAIAACSQAMASERPMRKLLQGDVGSGKTVIAAFVGARAVLSGYQSALLVPTKLLADQHVRTLRSLLAPFDVEVQAMDGQMSSEAREGLLARLRRGEPLFVVGTHALLEESVAFAALGAAIIDEQHRFGVSQRRRFEEKGPCHLLVMSATPIPRTLALALLGDLECIDLREKPPGRLPVDTRWIHPRDRERVYAFLMREVARGRQAYVVFPRIDGDDEGGGAADQAELLARTWLKGARVGLLHGQMSEVEQERVMRRFVEGSLDVLVATTVIEVGVDVPRASVMVVEEADRFGLAQLHQLRGRVGRGGEGGYTLLISEAPTEAARRRLEALRTTDDGFEIAELDLALRGPGELGGVRQAGPVDFRFADLSADRDLLEAAAKEAEHLLSGSAAGDGGEGRRDEAWSE